MAHLLAGKTVVLTGAGGGFGRELTRQLAQTGCRLVLTSRDPVKLQAAAGLAGPALLGVVAADLADVAGCAAAYEQCAAIIPAPDLLILNAGVALYGMVVDIPRPTWEQLIAVNLLGPMRLCAHFLPAMIRRGQGQIVLISSILGLAGLPGVSLYAATKFGLRGFGEALAADLRPHGIAVSLVYPFFTQTAILDAEQYGPGARQRVPPFLVNNPRRVIARIIAGIARRERHIYPGLLARSYALAGRLAPGLLVALTRFFTGGGSRSGK